MRANTRSIQPFSADEESRAIASITCTCIVHVSAWLPPMHCTNESPVSARGAVDPYAFWIQPLDLRVLPEDVVEVFDHRLLLLRPSQAQECEDSVC
eukprot:1847198-Rhodomonas_salina.2